MIFLRNHKVIFFNVFLTIILLLVAANNSYAVENNSGILDSVLTRYKTATGAWAGVLTTYAQWLFWGLALLSLTWTYAFMALRKADIQEFFAETIRFFATLSFFFWILSNAPALSTAIIDTMRKIGSDAIGSPVNLSPSGIVDIGFQIFDTTVQNSSAWSPARSICGVFMAGIILFILTLIAINMLMLLCSGWFLAYAGIFYLGFGGAKWTSDIAINYYKTVLSIATKTFAMILVIGVGRSFLDTYYAAMNQGISLKDMGVMFVTVLVLYKLSSSIPDLLSGMVSGHIGSVGSVGAGEVVVGAALAAGGAAMAGNALMGAAAQAAGGTSALTAAFQSAQANMEGSNAGSGTLASAFSKAGSIVAGMGTNLAQGGKQVAGEKAKEIYNSALETIKDKTSQSFGGKVASAIKENSNSVSSGKSGNKS